MAIYGIDSYGISYYGYSPSGAVSQPATPGLAVLAYDSSPFVAEPLGFNGLQLTWTLPADPATPGGPGTWDALALSRSSYGFPIDLESSNGTVLFTQYMPPLTTGGTHANAVTSWQDTPLTPGKFYYYSLFARTMDATPVWRPAGVAIGLVTQDFDYVDRLFELLPEVYRSQDQLLALDESGGPLFRFFGLLNTQLSLIRTEMNSLKQVNNPVNASGGLLPLMAKQLGTTYEPSVGMALSRTKLENIVHLYKWKGTKAGIEGIASAVSGYAALVQTSTNMLLDYNDSRFEETVGNWRPAQDDSGNRDCEIIRIIDSDLSWGFYVSAGDYRVKAKSKAVLRLRSLSTSHIFVSHGEANTNINMTVKITNYSTSTNFLFVASTHGVFIGDVHVVSGGTSTETRTVIAIDDTVGKITYDSNFSITGHTTITWRIRSGARTGVPVSAPFCFHLDYRFSLDYVNRIQISEGPGGTTRVSDTTDIGITATMHTSLVAQVGGTQRDAKLHLEFYDHTGLKISRVSSATITAASKVPANAGAVAATWNRISHSAIVPSGATHCAGFVEILGTVTNEIHFMDKVHIEIGCHPNHKRKLGLIATPANGAAPLATIFTVFTLPKRYVKWRLYFGDGAYQDGRYPFPAAGIPHTYAAIGNYQAEIDIWTRDKDLDDLTRLERREERLEEQREYERRRSSPEVWEHREAVLARKLQRIEDQEAKLHDSDDDLRPAPFKAYAAVSAVGTVQKFDADQAVAHEAGFVARVGPYAGAREVTITLVASRTNLVPNPSFEVDNKNWLAVGNNTTITRDTSIIPLVGPPWPQDPVPSGDVGVNYVLPQSTATGRVRVTALAPGRTTPEDIDVYTQVKVQAGATYVLSAYVTSATQPRMVAVYIDWRDRFNQSVGHTTWGTLESTYSVWYTLMATRWETLEEAIDIGYSPLNESVTSPTIPAPVIDSSNPAHVLITDTDVGVGQSIELLSDPSNNIWYRPYVIATAPDNADHAFVHIQIFDPALNEDHYIDAVLFERANFLNDYFDASIGQTLGSVINSNPNLTTDVSTYTVTNATLAWNGAAPHATGGSAALTGSGAASSYMLLTTALIPITQKTNWQVTALVEAATVARSTWVQIDFYDQNNAFMPGQTQTSFLTPNDITTGFISVVGQFFAPEGAYGMKASVAVWNPANGEVHYVDQFLVQQINTLADYMWGGAVHDSPSYYYPHKALRNNRLNLIVPDFIPAGTSFALQYAVPTPTDP